MNDVEEIKSSRLRSRVIKVENFDKELTLVNQLVETES